MDFLRIPFNQREVNRSHIDPKIRFLKIQSLFQKAGLPLHWQFLGLVGDRLKFPKTVVFCISSFQGTHSTLIKQEMRALLFGPESA